MRGQDSRDSSISGRRYVQGLSALLLANVLWATSYAVGKQVMLELSPSVVTFWKCLSGGLLLFPGVPGLLKMVAPIDRRLLVLSGVLGVALASLLFSTGLELTLSANAALISSTEPVFAVALAAFFLRESLPSRAWWCIPLALLGSLLLSWDAASLGLLRADQARGNLLLLVAALFFGLQTVLMRALCLRVPVRVVTSVPFLVAAVVLVPFLEGPLLPVSREGWLGLIYLVMVTFTLGYSLWNWGIQFVAAGQAALTLYLQPLLGALLGALLLQEALPSTFALSSFLIFSSVIWMNLQAGSSLPYDELDERLPSASTSEEPKA